METIQKQRSLLLHRLTTCTAPQVSRPAGHVPSSGDVVVVVAVVSAVVVVGAAVVVVVVVAIQAPAEQVPAAPLAVVHAAPVSGA